MNDTQTLPAAMAVDIDAACRRFGIVGRAPALIEAVRRALIVAPVDLSVLVCGESGTGKEFFPKIIHAFSARKHSKYIAVNCGAIPEGTIDSELFGHEKGSFTGALAARKGYFEEAAGGTVFLDEVAELPLTTQARLLRVLESGEYLRVGSSDVRRTDVRIVAATNVDLPAAVAEGRFREDLYYRLSTVRITVPPLRDRGDDVGMLARKFASDFAEKYMTPRITFTPDALRMLAAAPWPGNVRQLKNAVENIALFHAGGEIDTDLLAPLLPRRPFAATPALRRPEASYDSEREMLWQMIFALRTEINGLRAQICGSDTPAPRPITTLPAAADLLARSTPEPFIDAAGAEEAPASLRESERDTIIRALRRNGGQRKKTADELNISERTLYRKLRRYNLDDSSATDKQ